jgi:hypothetical protein
MYTFNVWEARVLVGSCTQLLLCPHATVLNTLSSYETAADACLYPSSLL